MPSFLTEIVLYYIDNKGFTIWKLFPNFISRLITNIIVPVDTFFFSSGFLLTYLYLKDKIGTKRTTSINYKAKLNEFFIHIITRFIRYVFKSYLYKINRQMHIKII